jgi:hypothetical protein
VRLTTGRRGNSKLGDTCGLGGGWRGNSHRQRWTEGTSVVTLRNVLCEAVCRGVFVVFRSLCKGVRQRHQIDGEGASYQATPVIIIAGATIAGINKVGNPPTHTFSWFIELSKEHVSTKEAKG